MKIEVLTPGRNRGGRPRADEPRSTVSTWLPARQHDALIREANARGMSVSALVKQVLADRARKSS